MISKAPQFAITSVSVLSRLLALSSCCCTACTRLAARWVAARCSLCLSRAAAVEASVSRAAVRAASGLGSHRSVTSCTGSVSSFI